MYVDPMTVAFVDALGGPEGLIDHPMMRHPFDRSQVESLTRSPRAALRVEAGLAGTVAAVRARPVSHDLPARVITAGKPASPHCWTNCLKCETSLHRSSWTESSLGLRTGSDCFDS